MSDTGFETSAEVVQPAGDLDATIAFFVERLGFRLDAIFPADEPRTAIVSGHGVRVRLEGERADVAPGRLRLVSGDLEAGELVAPNGTRVDVVAPATGTELPPEPSGERQVVVTRAGDDWVVGRAGMRYRDLVPGRVGGRFIASHIRIEHGGPVPDYVHFHRVRFQAIHCVRGWVRLVYEDQGEPFVLRAGDCVLQPPTIRHRVLECSDGLEVVEVAAPARHETLVEHVLELPNGLDEGRSYGGQRFVRHRADAARWADGGDGFERRDSGLGEATGGLLGLRVARPASASEAPARSFEGEGLFLFVAAGRVTLEAEGAMHVLETGDAAYVPGGVSYRVATPSPDAELLEFEIPAR